MPKRNNPNRKQQRRQRVPKRIRDPVDRAFTVQIADDTQLLATGAATIATTLSINPGSISSDVWSGMKSAFRYFKVNWVIVMIIPISSAAGSTMFYWDNTSSTVPNQASAIGALGEQLTNNSAAATRINVKGYKYTGYSITAPFTKNERTTVNSYFDWNSTGAAAIPMYLKVFTDLTLFGSPVTTNLWNIRTLYSVSFKTQAS